MKIYEKVITFIAFFLSITLHAAIFSGISVLGNLGMKNSMLVNNKNNNKELISSVEIVNATELPDIKKLGNESKIIEKEGNETKNSEEGIGDKKNKIISSEQNEEAMLKFEDRIKFQIQKNKYYPEIAKKLGIEGKVGISFDLLKDGQVEDIRILESSGNKILDSEAVNTIKKCIPFEKIPDYYNLNKMNLQVKIIYKLN